MDNKILIVEDDYPYLQELSLSFQKNRFEVITAQDGQQGFDIALEKKPALILLDIVLPGMTGLEVLRSLRKDSWGAKVPVIILSNLEADKKVLDDVTLYNPLYYFLKSNISIDEIVHKVAEFLDSQG